MRGNNLSREEKRELKKKKVAISKIMTPVVMILFVLLLLMILNFHSLCHVLNIKSYATVRAEIVEKTTDPLAMVIPMAIVRYEYEGTIYEDRKYFALQPFFGLSPEAGTKLDIYVNKGAPNHFIFRENFFVNWINWLLLFFEGVFISLLVRRIRRLIQNHKEKKKRKRTGRGIETGHQESSAAWDVGLSEEKWEEWVTERSESDGED